MFDFPIPIKLLRYLYSLHRISLIFRFFRAFSCFFKILEWLTYFTLYFAFCAIYCNQTFGSLHTLVHLHFVHKNAPLLVVFMTNASRQQCERAFAWHAYYAHKKIVYKVARFIHLYYSCVVKSRNLSWGLINDNTFHFVMLTMAIESCPSSLRIEVTINR